MGEYPGVGREDLDGPVSRSGETRTPLTTVDSLPAFSSRTLYRELAESFVVRIRRQISVAELEFAPEAELDALRHVLRVFLAMAQRPDDATDRSRAG